LDTQKRERRGLGKKREKSKKEKGKKTTKYAEGRSGRSKHSFRGTPGSSARRKKKKRQKDGKKKHGRRSLQGTVKKGIVEACQPKEKNERKRGHPLLREEREKKRKRR